MRKLVLAFLIGTLWIQMPVIHAAEVKDPIIFVIDTSGSMKGEKLVAVKNALNNIVNNLQKDQPIALISFSEKVSTIMPPSLDFDLVQKKINSLKAGGNTSLYDAIASGFTINTAGPKSRMILLSDGEDTASSLKYEELLGKATSAGVPVSAIGIQVTSKQQQVLGTIAKVSGGKYYAVDEISQLIETFQEILEVQPAPSPSPNVDSSNTTGEIALNRNVYIRVILATFAGIVLFLLLIIIYQRTRNRRQHLKRVQTIQEYSFTQFRKTSNRIKITIISNSFVPKRIETAIKLRLEIIHSTIRYETILYMLFFAWVVFLALFTSILHSLIVALIFTSFLIPFCFTRIIKIIHQKQKQKFAEGLPDLLNILASALRSGLSLPQGLEAYSADTEGEVAREIRRSIAEIRVGTPIEEALSGVAERMDNEDLRWAVEALSIQREVGGSMATILTTTFETVKARAEIRREVKTLSAEGKLSAYVLIALPLGIFSFLFLSRREYVKVFWTDPAGILLLIIIGISLSIGWAWMKKIVEIKI